MGIKLQKQIISSITSVTDSCYIWAQKRMKKFVSLLPCFNSPGVGGWQPLKLPGSVVQLIQSL